MPHFWSKKSFECSSKTNRCICSQILNNFCMQSIHPVISDQDWNRMENLMEIWPQKWQILESGNIFWIYSCQFSSQKILSVVFVCIFVCVFFFVLIYIVVHNYVHKCVSKNYERRVWTFRHYENQCTLYMFFYYN